jgi:hypothetical protein
VIDLAQGSAFCHATPHGLPIEPDSVIETTYPLLSVHVVFTESLQPYANSFRGRRHNHTAPTFFFTFTNRYLSKRNSSLSQLRTTCAHHRLNNYQTDFESPHHEPSK